MGSWVIYTYWNADSVISVLNAIAAIMGGSDYVGLLKTFVLLGMLLAAGYGLLKFTAAPLLTYFAWVALSFYVLFAPKITVDVVDVKTGTTNAVANVPFGVGASYAMFSHIGKYLTDTFEMSFQPVDSLRFGKTGLAFGARAYKDLTSTGFHSPKLGQAFTSFTGSCINPELLDSSDKYSEVLRSENIWGTILQVGWLNPARVVSIPVNEIATVDTYMSCPTAALELDKWSKADASSSLSVIAQKLYPDKGAASADWTYANAMIAQSLADVDGYFLQISRNAIDNIRQSVAINAFDDATSSLAQARGDASAMQSKVAATIAMAQSQSAYRTMAAIGEQALPKFRNIIEVLIIAVAPIVFLSILLAGEKGFLVFKTYAMTMMWVQLWAPLYAVVNFLMLDGMANRLQATLLSARSQTLLNQALLHLTAFEEQSLAGILVMAVPAVAFALLKGGEVAMGNVMGSMSSSLSRHAESAGALAGAGNTTLGTTSIGTSSMNNMSSNKWDDTGNYATSAWNQSSGGVRAGFGGGNVWSSSQGSNSDLGAFSVSVGQMASTAASHARSAASSRTTDAMQQIGKGFSALFNATSSSSNSLANMQSLSSNATSSQAGGWNSSATTSFGSSLDWGRQQGLTAAETASLTLAGSLGTAGIAKAIGALSGSEGASDAIKGLGKTLSAGVDASTGGKAQLSDVNSAAQRASQSQDWKEGYARLSTSQLTSSAGHGSTGSSTQTSAVTAAANQITQANASASSSFAQMQRAESIQSQASSSNAGIQRNLANEIVGSMGTKAAGELFRSGADSVKAEQAIQSAVKAMIDPSGNLQAVSSGQGGPSRESVSEQTASLKADAQSHIDDAHQSAGGPALSSNQQNLVGIASSGSSSKVRSTSMPIPSPTTTHVNTGVVLTASGVVASVVGQISGAGVKVGDGAQTAQDSVTNQSRSISAKLDDPSVMGEAAMAALPRAVTKPSQNQPADYRNAP